MEHMQQELADMIGFWCYDAKVTTEQRASNTTIETDFFNIAPNSYKQTFLEINETQTRPLCGELRSLNALFTFGDDSEVGSRRLQPMPQPIYD